MIFVNAMFFIFLAEMAAPVDLDLCSRDDGEDVDQDLKSRALALQAKIKHTDLWEDLMKYDASDSLRKFRRHASLCTHMERLHTVLYSSHNHHNDRLIHQGWLDEINALVFDANIFKVRGMVSKDDAAGFAETLVSRGVDINSTRGGNLLYLVVMHRAVECLKYLVSRPDFNVDNVVPVHNTTVLHHAAQVHENTEFSWSSLPIQEALQRSVKMVELLLTRSDLDVNILDGEGRSPLWCTAVTRVADVLLADPRTDVNLSGGPELKHEYESIGAYDIFEFGGGGNATWVELSQEGWTKLHQVLFYSTNTKLLKRLLMHPHIDVNKTTPDGETPLFMIREEPVVYDHRGTPDDDYVHRRTNAFNIFLKDERITLSHRNDWDSSVLDLIFEVDHRELILRAQRQHLYWAMQKIRMIQKWRVAPHQKSLEPSMLIEYLLPYVADVITPVHQLLGEQELSSLGWCFRNGAGDSTQIHKYKQDNHIKF